MPFRHIAARLGLGAATLAAAFAAAPSPALAADASADLFGFRLDPGVVGQYDHGVLTGAGAFGKANVGGFLSMTCVPFVATVANTSSTAQDIRIYPGYRFAEDATAIDRLDRMHAVVAGNPRDAVDNLTDLRHGGTGIVSTTSTWSSAGPIAVTVSGPFGGTDTNVKAAPRAQDQYRFYEATLKAVPANGTAELVFCANLGPSIVEASAYPHLRLIGEDPELSSTSIAVDYPTIYEEPWLALAATSTDGRWPTATSTFTITPAINGEADGIQTAYPYFGTTEPPLLVFANQALEREYRVAFAPPTGYAVVTSTGDNVDCVVDGASAVATIRPQNPRQDAACHFTITPVAPPRYRAMANIIGGTLAPTSVKMYIDGAAVEHGVYREYTPGEHSLFVETPVAYDRTAIHGDCDGAANIVLGYGDEKTCTVDLTAARAYITPSLNLVNDNGGSASTSDIGVAVGGSATSFGLRTLLAGATTTIAISAPAGYVATFEGPCNAEGLVTLALGDDATCTVTVNDPEPANNGGGSGGGSSSGGSSSGGSGGGSSGGSSGGSGGGATTASGSSGISSGGGSSGGSASSTPVAVATPAPSILARVLGESFSDGSSSCLTDEPDAAFITANPMDLLRGLGRILDAISPTNLALSLAQRVLPDDATEAERAAVSNFLSFGTRTSLKLGEGERAGVVDSFRAAYGRIPKTECDWQDALRIANGKLPGQRVPAREAASAQLFATLFGRKPDTNRTEDRRAIDMMSYGIRPQARDLAAETNAIRFFRGKMGHNPANATEWDAVRAIAYAGVH